MRILFVVFLGVAVLIGSCFAAEQPSLKDPKAKESYSLGFQFGENLKKQNADVDMKLIEKGLEDALGAKKALMSSDEMRESLKDLRQRVMAEQRKAGLELAAKNLEASKTFLEQNKKKDGVVVTPSGLQYKILSEGSGRTPKSQDSVTVNYRGTLLDGTEFDSSYKRGKPESLQVDGVIPGWTEALQMMKEGAKWQLFVPPDLAYGDRAMGSLIGPNSALIFEVELISINPETPADDEESAAQ